jgi:mannose-1-phosphate guanylyltransferase
MDIGTPERYLEATFDILEGNVATEVSARLGEKLLCIEDGVTREGRVIPPALIESGCVIGKGARVGGRAVLERNVTVGAGTVIESAVVMEGAEIGANCALHDCIVAAGVKIGDHCTINGLSVVGEGVTLGANNQLSHGARLFPGVSLGEGALLF